MPTLRQQFAREYVAFHDARNRCTNPNIKSFPHYGGRGIAFRFTDFEQFIGHVGPRPEGYQLDRIDNDGHYEPGNVRWASRELNNRNKRDNLVLTHDGRTQTLMEWANELRLDFRTLRARFHKGWPAARILSTTKQCRWPVYGPLPACKRI